MKDARVGDSIRVPAQGGYRNGSVIAVVGSRAQISWTPGFKITWREISGLTLVTRR
jgi:hypothetical protein